MDRTSTQPGASPATHQIIELKEMQLGVAPDPKLFDLQGLTIFMP
jgi:hypothetical protein